MVDLKSLINLRKFNSLLIILLILMLLYHGILSVLSFYTIIPYSPDLRVTGRRLFYIVFLHAVISTYLYLKDKSNRTRTYSHLISQTTQQIISGIFIVIFVLLHVLSNSYYPIGVNFGFEFILLHFLIDALLFTSIVFHLKISIPRALISFGFLSSKNSYKNAQKRVNIILIIFWVIFVFAEIFFYVVIL